LGRVFEGVADRSRIAARLKLVFDAARLPAVPSDTHIISLHVGDLEKCKVVCDLVLSEYGIYIQPINYPTVPRVRERLQIADLLPCSAIAAGGIAAKVALPQRRGGQVVD
jgi:7-keto-8-aminopelargonate synthetase-like enzyme